jgi:uncharacterized protein YqgC (DUF456 family)
MMLYILLTLLVVTNATMLLLNLFALPGNWLMITLTALFAWWQSDASVFSVYTLIVAVVIAIAGEIVEFLAGPGGARKAGSTFRGVFGAIVGMMAGAIAGTVMIPIPIIGTIIGGALGACLGTAALELNAGKKLDHSFRAGFGAGIGVVLGTGGKFLIGVLIWIIIALAAFIS